MKRKIHSFLHISLILILSAFLTANAVAAKTSDSTSIYDESAYTAQMERDMDRLDSLYLKYNDKSVSSGDVQKAKREYFRIAHKILKNMNQRFDNLDPKTGAALSDTELILINHIQIMLIDMLANIHQSEWLRADDP